MLSKIRILFRDTKTPSNDCVHFCWKSIKIDIDPKLPKHEKGFVRIKKKTPIKHNLFQPLTSTCRSLGKVTPVFFSNVKQEAGSYSHMRENSLQRTWYSLQDKDSTDEIGPMSLWESWIRPAYDEYTCTSQNAKVTVNKLQRNCNKLRFHVA